MLLTLYVSTLDPQKYLRDRDATGIHWYCRIGDALDIPGTSNALIILEGVKGFGNNLWAAIKYRSFFGLNTPALRELPGASKSTYVGFEADVEKRDAVVEAFRVRPITLL